MDATRLRVSGYSNASFTPPSVSLAVGVWSDFAIVEDGERILMKRITWDGITVKSLTSLKGCLQAITVNWQIVKWLSERDCSTNLHNYYLPWRKGYLIWRKPIIKTFSMFYSDKTWIFDQSECAQCPIYIIKTTKALRLSLFSISLDFLGPLDRD